MSFQILSTKRKYKQIHHTHTNTYISQKTRVQKQEFITQSITAMQDDLHAVKIYIKRSCKNSNSLLFTKYSSISSHMTVHTMKWYATKWMYKGSVPTRKVAFIITPHTAFWLTYHPIWWISTALSVRERAGTWSWLLQPVTDIVKTIKSLLQHLLYTVILKSGYFSLPLTFFSRHIQYSSLTTDHREVKSDINKL